MLKLKTFFLPASTLAFLALGVAGALHAQLSSSAYRVLGQTDLRQSGLNLVQGVELFSPSGIALDTRSGAVRLYVSDTRNSRVMAWEDARAYQNGDPPALILGQPGPQFSNVLGIGAKGFNAPLGLAVDPSNGNLYVADFGNNRVLRFPSPFANPTRVEPDAVYGQPNFTSRGANQGGITRGSLNRPRAVAFDSAGNLWVADSGNNRILRFNAGVLDSLTPPDADMVIGQKDFATGGANRASTAISASGLDTPSGLVFDQQNNLYVTDFNNTRVLKFSAPLGPTSPDPAATAVWGEADFRSRGVPNQASASTLAGPVGVAVDNGGSLYVAVPLDNRVLVFPAGATTGGGAAQNVFGQSDFSTTTANAAVFPQASANTLSAPFDVKVDPNGNTFVADTSNNRVLQFSAGSKSASRVWGQTDFSSNGPNQVKAGSINAPYKMAIDYSRTPFPLYVSDTNNHRVLVWKDATRFRNGDPADLVIGQPDFRTAVPNVDTRSSSKPSATSLAAPAGIVVDQTSGALYVADALNNRVLRYPSPVTQPGRITPDLVLGQADFTSSASAAVTAASLRAPAGLALGTDGSLFVADSGNNRVLEFAAGAVSGAAAVRVYGQATFTSSLAQGRLSAQTLTNPQGVYVDASFTLYVADTGNNRLLIFPNTQGAPTAGMAAAFVIGHGSFDGLAGGTSFKSPTDTAVNSNGDIFVVDGGNNRVLIFPSLVFLPITGATAIGVVGQRDLAGTVPNWNSTNGLPTPEGLFAPVGLYLDRQDTLYVGDAGNSRLVHFLKPVSAVNAATLQSSVPVGLGGLVNLVGAGFSNDTAAAPEMPWPVELAQREVVINDEIRAPLASIEPGRAKIQFPSAAPLGTQRIAIRVSDTGELVAGGNVIVAAASPGLFSVSQDGKGQALATNQDGRPNSASNPAARGATITLYGTGQGQVSPPVADGAPAPADVPSNTVAVPTSDGKTCLTSQPSICLALGTSSFGEIQSSGLAPGYIGMWQITIKIPQDVPPGNAVPVRALINATPSNVVTIAVR